MVRAPRSAPRPRAAPMMHNASPLVSIVINNYNYAQFLPEAIDSALNQSFASTEVVVVDDGSSDRSRQIIANYGRRIVPVLKQNGGQASAFNAGIAKSRGEFICLLDSDDYFTPDKVTQIVTAFNGISQSTPILLHHLLCIVGTAAGKLAGRMIGQKHTSPLNLYDFARRYRFIPYRAGPTTSLSFNRQMANRLFPIPEDGIRTSADDFIVKGASLVGELYSLQQQLGYYRVHGANAWFQAGAPKPQAFFEALDLYLNKVLADSGHIPVMSFSNSMACWTDLALQRRWLELIRHIARLSLLQHDLLTVRFALRALRWAFNGQTKAEKSEVPLI